MLEQAIRLAVQQARVSFALGEVPIGAVVFNDSNILGFGRNQVEEKRDQTQHAEIVSLQRAAKSRGDWRLNDASLYCTVEPCPMCVAAIQAFRISNLYYGTAQPRLGAIESFMRMTEDYQHPQYKNKIQSQGGINREESAVLLKEFFGNRRRAQRAAKIKAEGGEVDVEGKDGEFSIFDYVNVFLKLFVLSSDGKLLMENYDDSFSMDKDNAVSLRIPRLRSSIGLSHRQSISAFLRDHHDSIFVQDIQHLGILERYYSGKGEESDVLSPPGTFHSTLEAALPTFTPYKSPDILYNYLVYADSMPSLSSAGLKHGWSWVNRKDVNSLALSIEERRFINLAYSFSYGEVSECLTEAIYT